jgi:hypothetical protein
MCILIIQCSYTSALHFGHLQWATGLIDVYSVYGNLVPYTLYLCVLKCCMEDVRHQLQSYLPSIKSSIRGLSDFSEHVSDLSDFSPHVSIANTIHISVAPDFITHMTLIFCTLGWLSVNFSLPPSPTQSQSSNTDHPAAQYLLQPATTSKI